MIQGVPKVSFMNGRSAGSCEYLVDSPDLSTCRPQKTNQLFRYRDLELVIKRLKETFASQKKGAKTPETQHSLQLPTGNIILAIDKTSASLQASDTVIAFWYCDKSMLQISSAQEERIKETTRQIRGLVSLGAQSAGFSKGTAEQLHQSQPSFSLSPDVMLRLPPIKGMGGILIHSNLVDIDASLVIDRFTGAFEPNVLDRLLSMWNTINQDASALISMSKSMQGHQGKTSSTPGFFERNFNSSDRKIRYVLGVRSDGISVSLKAAQVVSTLSITTGTITGDLASDGESTEPTWSAGMSSLSIALGVRQSSEAKPDGRIKPETQSAYMKFGLRVVQSPETNVYAKGSDRILTTHPTTIDVMVANVHAAIEVSALGQIYDIMEGWSADLRAIRTRRKEQWENVISTTEKLMKPDRPATPQRPFEEDWFLMKRIINIRLTGLAIAIPLNVGGVLDPLTNHSPALLFTIAQIEICNQKGETGKVEIMDVILQIVTRYVQDLTDSPMNASLAKYAHDLLFRFDTTDSLQYDGLKHVMRNRMHLPHTLMETRLVPHPDVQGRKILLANSTFRGFELRLDPLIVKYTKMLKAVYEAGKSRVEQLALEYPLDTSSSQKNLEGRPAPTAKHKWPVDLQGSFNFYSGRVQLFQSSRDENRSSKSTNESSSMTPDTIKLPGISLWARGAEDLKSDAAMDNTIQISIVSRFHKSIQALRLIESDVLNLNRLCMLVKISSSPRYCGLLRNRGEASLRHTTIIAHPRRVALCSQSRLLARTRNNALVKRLSLITPQPSPSSPL